MKTMRSRVAAIAVASAIALTPTVATVPAFAQEAGVETTPAPAPAADLVDPASPVSLTINKYLGEVGDTSTPLGGIQFKIEKIDGVDLTTQAGWAEVAAMTPQDLQGNTATELTTVTTDGSGVAKLDTATNAGFTVGVYRITEVQSGDYTAAPPFLLTLPSPQQDGSFAYDQTVNPKNQDVTPTKQVDDTNATIGSNLKYTINAPVPGGDLSATSRFGIKDPLNASLALDTAQTPVVRTTGAAPTTLVAGTDYNLDTANNTLTVNFTDAGLTKLEEARKTDPALTVVVEFQATIQSIPAEGSITNTAQITLPGGEVIDTNGDDPSTPDTVEDNPTSTTFGNLTITKTSGATEGSLNGAEFQLYLCEPKADGSGMQILGDPLTLGTGTDAATATPGDTLVTAGGGDSDASDATAQGFGVPIQSFAAGTGTVANGYCVVESKAPAGFVRNPEPQLVDVDLAARTLTASVDNQRNTIFGQLPATGAWGIILILLLGLALLARGIYTNYKDSRLA